jgi:hypothetical protein
MQWGTREIAIIVLLELQMAPSFSAEGVPEQLRGRSVVSSWVESRDFEATDRLGRSHGDTLYGGAKIYISTQGNIFGRQEARIVINDTAEIKSFSTEDAASKDGNYVKWEFDRGVLAGNIVNTQGVKRVSVTFSNQYKQCRLNVIYGKLGGADSFKIQGWHNDIYVLRSSKISNNRCFVQSGNVLGGTQ